MDVGKSLSTKGGRITGRRKGKRKTFKVPSSSFAAGRESKNVFLRQGEFIRTSIFPILPFVFFFPLLLLLWRWPPFAIVRLRDATSCVFFPREERAGTHTRARFRPRNQGARERAHPSVDTPPLRGTQLRRSFLQREGGRRANASVVSCDVAIRKEGRGSLMSFPSAAFRDRLSTLC